VAHSGPAVDQFRVKDGRAQTSRHAAGWLKPIYVMKMGSA